MTSAYDAVPYPGVPRSEADPDRLLTLRWLLGGPPPPTSPRVLDLGCGVGVPLINAALARPDSTFVGVDRSAVQLQIATDLAARVGARNVSFVQADLDDDLGVDGPFDVIVAWGVYTWVSPATQRALLQHVARRLAPDGLAVLGVNTTPGWHMLGALRSLMRFHARTTSDPMEQVRLGREAIRFAQASTWADEDLYAAWLAHAVELLEHLPDAAVLHDFFSPEHHPVSLTELNAAAQEAGLRWWTDARHGSTRTDAFPTALRAVLDDAWTQTGDRVHVNQLMDFLRNKRFRAAVLTHAGPNPVEPAPERFAACWFRAEHGPPQPDDDGGWQVTGDRSAPLATPTAIAVGHALARARPDFLDAPTIAARAARPLPDVLDVLAHLWRHDLLDVRHTPPERPSAVGPFPACTPFARAVLADPRLSPACPTGTREAPAWLGTSATLPPETVALLLDLDGNTTPDTIREAWTARLPADEVLLPDALDRALLELRRSGLLTA